MASTRTTWVDEYQQHSCWNQLEGILEITSDVVPNESEYADRLNRIRMVALTGQEAKDASPILVDPSLLTALEEAATNVHAPLQNWAAADHENNSHIDQAFVQLPSLQSALSTLPAPAATSLRSAAATLRHVVSESNQSVESLNAHINSLENKQEESLKNHLDKAQSKFEELKERITETQASIEKTISEAEASAAALAVRVKAIGTQSSEAIESQQRQFLTAEESRTKSHADLVAEHKEDLENRLDTTQNEFAEYLETEKAQVEKERTAIETARKSAENTVGAIGVQATAKWYEDNSDSQRAAADKWRWIATGLFLIAFGVVGYSVFFSDHADDSWKSTVLKSTATISLVAGAVYAQSESGKHREEEFRSKSTELTLRALEPFIANLSPNLKTRLRTEAARQVFTLKPEADDEDYYQDEGLDEEFSTDS